MNESRVVENDLGVYAVLRHANPIYERPAFEKGWERSQRRLHPSRSNSSKSLRRNSSSLPKVNLNQAFGPKGVKSLRHVTTPHRPLRALGTISAPSHAIPQFRPSGDHRVASVDTRKCPPVRGAYFRLGGLRLSFGNLSCVP